MALGRTALAIRILSSFLCGAAAGLLIRAFYRKSGFFNFAGFAPGQSRDTDPNLLMRFLKNLGRNIKATGPMFLLGVVLSALFQRYVFQWLLSACWHFNVQLFVTTHSLESISALVRCAVEDSDSELACYRLEKDLDQVYAKRFSERDLNSLLNGRGINVR